MRIGAGQAWIVRDTGGTLLALLVLEPRERCLLIDSVAAIEPARGRGLAQRLLAFAEAEARRRGYGELRLYTHSTITENWAMYRHLGWEPFGTVTEMGFARVHFRKRVR